MLQVSGRLAPMLSDEHVVRDGACNVTYEQTQGGKLFKLGVAPDCGEHFAQRATDLDDVCIRQLLRKIMHTSVPHRVQATEAGDNFTPYHVMRFHEKQLLSEAEYLRVIDQKVAARRDGSYDPFELVLEVKVGAKDDHDEVSRLGHHLLELLLVRFCSEDVRTRFCGDLLRVLNVRHRSD
jgi:hypothetical protein